MQKGGSLPAHGLSNIWAAQSSCWLFALITVIWLTSPKWQLNLRIVLRPQTEQRQEETGGVGRQKPPAPFQGSWQSPKCQDRQFKPKEIVMGRQVGGQPSPLPAHLAWISSFCRSYPASLWPGLWPCVWHCYAWASGYRGRLHHADQKLNLGTFEFK